MLGDGVEMKKYIQTSCQYGEIQARLDEYARNGYRLAAALPLVSNEYCSQQMQLPAGAMAGYYTQLSAQQQILLTSVLLIFEGEE